MTSLAIRILKYIWLPLLLTAGVAICVFWIPSPYAEFALGISILGYIAYWTGWFWTRPGWSTKFSIIWFFGISVLMSTGGFSDTAMKWFAWIAFLPGANAYWRIKYGATEPEPVKDSGQDDAS